MAKLIRQTGDDPGDIIKLKPGRNRFGTSEDCDFIVDHSSVSPSHCELTVDHRGLNVCDLDSANGTFVDEVPVSEMQVVVGQVIRMGEVQLKVSDVRLASATTPLPVQSPLAKPASCPQHPNSELSFRCSHCGVSMCTHCVHVLKVHAGHGMFLCPHCSHPCESMSDKDTRELATMVDHLVMVRRAFAIRPRKPRPAPED